jgi:hypothetical protein
MLVLTVAECGFKFEFATPWNGTKRYGVARN